jgi:hypothetical protein
MKQSGKQNKRVMFIKRAIFILLIFCLTQKENIRASSEESLGRIRAVDKDIATIRQKDKTRKARKDKELYEEDTITINRQGCTYCPPSIWPKSRDLIKPFSDVMNFSCTSNGIEIEYYILCPPKVLSKEVSEFNIKALCVEQSTTKVEQQEQSLVVAIYKEGASSFDLGLTKGGAARWQHLQKAEIVDLVAPVATNVLTRQPRFRWLPLQGVDQYELTVFDGLSNRLWCQTTTGTELPYPHPPDAPELVPGEYYFWQVKGVAGSKEKEANPFQEQNLFKNIYATYGMTYFTVLPEEEIATINQEVAEAHQLMESPQDELFHLLLGIYYEKKQLYGEAQTEYEKLQTDHPQNDLYKKILAHLYVTIGRKWAAAEDMGLVPKQNLPPCR